MRDTLLNIYSKTEKSFKEPRRAQNTIEVSFLDSAKVSINGPIDQSYTVKFINNKNNLSCILLIYYLKIH